MGYKEISGLGQAQLKEHHDALRKELLMMRFDKASGKLLDTTSPRRKRKELAQVMTRMTEIERVL